MDERVSFHRQQQLLEAQRIRQRTEYDMEMMQELGYCSGIENYSRVISGRAPGSAPMTLLDYFPKDFLLFIDESHVTLPQVRAMYNGDRARKETWWTTASACPRLRQPPAEIRGVPEADQSGGLRLRHPGDYERSPLRADRGAGHPPHGAAGPEVEVRPMEGQIDDLIGEINARGQSGTSARW
jgi:excinuclease ABC subunit B